MSLKSLTALIAILAATTVARADYPERPIQFLVPWNAGGGTDAIARAFAAGLEKELGVNVSVVNRPGGAGVIGHTAISQASPDGYTIGLGTAEMVSYYWNGQSELTNKNYTGIALINLDPGAVHISASSDWQNLKDVVEAIRKEPAGTYKLSGMGPGAAYHLAFAELLQKQDVDPLKVTVIPSQGAAPGFQELAAGGVDIIPSSLPEGRTMMEAGRSKAVAVLSEERNPAFPDVPTAKEAVGVDYANGTWRAVVGPAGLPQDVVARLSEASKAVYESEEFKKFMNAQGYGMRFEDAEGVTRFLADRQASVGEIMGALKLRVRD